MKLELFQAVQNFNSRFRGAYDALLEMQTEAEGHDFSKKTVRDYERQTKNLSEDYFGFKQELSRQLGQIPTLLALAEERGDEDLESDTYDLGLHEADAAIAKNEANNGSTSFDQMQSTQEILDEYEHLFSCIDLWAEIENKKAELHAEHDPLAEIKRDEAQENRYSFLHVQLYSLAEITEQILSMLSLGFFSLSSFAKRVLDPKPFTDTISKIRTHLESKGLDADNPILNLYSGTKSE